MSFLHPEFLYFMLPPLFILFGFLLTQKEVQAEFFSQEVMKKLRVNANTLSLKARNGLFFLIGFLIIVALSGPIIKEGKVQIKAKSADIMIALDISDSMLAEDVYPNRLRLAKQKAIDLINMAPNERIGVIAFAKNSYLVSPLSFDHGAVNFLLSKLDTTSITQKGTDIKSLLEIVDASIENNAKKYLLILSDGSDANDFTQEIAFVKEKNIVVFVLGMGTTKGAPIKLADGNFIKYDGEIIVSKLNDSIAKLAVESGGVYIENVKSQEDIKTMLREIEKIGEQKELKSEEVARFIPLFYYPLGLALLLLLIATSSMSKRVKVALPAFLLFTIVVTQPNAEALMLDFMELQEAKKAYERGDFNTSAQKYAKHANTTHNAQSYFNAGNALYSQEKYEEAVKAYKAAHFTKEHERALNYANMGNAEAKIGTQESLQNALKAYEESLKLQADKEVQENYEAVKKALHEQEKEEDKKEDKQENKEQDKQNKEQQEQKEEEKKQEQQEQNKEGENGSQDEKKKSQNKEEGKDKDASQDKEGDNSQENEQNKEQKSQEESEQERQKKNQEKKEELKELAQENNDTKKSSQNSAQAAKEKMSDAEEEKWINQLNMNQNSYMYMLNNENKNEEKTDEKPW